MTDAVLVLNNRLQSGAPPAENPAAAYPMMNTPQNPVNITQAAYQTTNPQVVQSPEVQADAARFGTRTPEQTDDESKLIPSQDQMTWGGSVWGDGKPGMYGNLQYYRTYMGWINNPAMAHADKTPEAFDRYYGISESQSGG